MMTKIAVWLTVCAVVASFAARIVLGQEQFEEEQLEALGIVLPILIRPVESDYPQAESSITNAAREALPFDGWTAKRWRPVDMDFSALTYLPSDVKAKFGSSDGPSIGGTILLTLFPDVTLVVQNQSVEEEPVEELKGSILTTWTGRVMGDTGGMVYFSVLENIWFGTIRMNDKAGTVYRIIPIEHGPHHVLFEADRSKQIRDYSIRQEAG